MILLETKRLILRNTRPEDAEVMYDYRNNEICARYQRGQTKDLPSIRQLVERRQYDLISSDKNFMLAVEQKKAEK